MLKIGPIMLRNILGPFLNTTLDQFLTLCFAETPIFIQFSSKNAKFNETQKRKKKTKHYLWEHLC